MIGGVRSTSAPASASPGPPPRRRRGALLPTPTSRCTARSAGGTRRELYNAGRRPAPPRPAEAGRRVARRNRARRARGGVPADDRCCAATTWSAPRRSCDGTPAPRPADARGLRPSRRARGRDRTLTRQVLRDAIADRARGWRTSGSSSRVAVNISARDLLDGLLADIDATLARHRCRPARSAWS